MEAVSTSSISETVSHLRSVFATQRTKPLGWRREQLNQLRRMFRVEESRLLGALHEDLRKSAFEAYSSEVGYINGDIDHTLKMLRKWMKPERVPTPLLNFKATSSIYREPLGVVLIIGPWNYPIQLLIAPLVGAIAAGNCAVLKPSEMTPASSKLLAEIVPKYLDQDCIRVVEGGVPETTELLEQRWDHIFFTGSTRVGKIVYQAAAKHLTPVALELGGKSPCIVDRDVDLDIAARRIVWGKYFNAGQTCVAPDYVLVDERTEQPLLERMKATVTQFYGADPQKSPDFPRIVSDGHFERLSKFLGDGEIVYGGRTDAKDRYIEPTALRGVKRDASIMNDEIFGPILPVLTVKDVDEAIEFVNDRPKPLALYMFSKDRARAERVLAKTSSGGACVNDALSHLLTPDLPFGGVGESGTGAYHGKSSFETFSHRKSVLHRSTLIDLKLRYPPYGDALKWIKKLLG